MKSKTETVCRKCGKIIRKGRRISKDGYCFRCDDNRTRKKYHISDGVMRQAHKQTTMTINLDKGG